MWIYWFCILGLAIGPSLGAHRIIETDVGKVKGYTEESWTGRTYWAFKGIRYAKPPIGPLRFKPPETPVEWTGVYDAGSDPPACMQAAAIFKNQSEDCLFLNIYTPKIETSQPVIVYLHHGSFLQGSARSDFLSPQYLMDQDIVLVVPNFRLGPFGFLSTGTKFSSGNYGLWDQVAVLKWVKDNINRFGGNPDLVTLAGYDTGATSALLHMTSPKSKDLFKKVIAMSGPVIGKWVTRKDSAKLATRIAQLNNCPTEKTEIMVNCLRTIPARQLADTADRMKLKMLHGMFLFTPVVETNSLSENRKFLTENPVNVLKTKKLDPKPVVLGITKDEYFGIKSLNEKQDELLDQLSAYNNLMNKDYLLKQIYMFNETLKRECYGTGKVLSDVMMILPSIRTAQLLAWNGCPTRFYMTTFAGSVSFLPDRKPTDVGHYDNLLYLFHLPQNLPKPWTTKDKEAHAVKVFTSMWANFAKTGNPRPTGMLELWHPWLTIAATYLDIGETLKMQLNIPHASRMTMLDNYVPPA